MEKSLKDQVALITGASRGIGRMIAFQLADMGANIVVNYVRNKEAAQETVSEILSKGVHAIPYCANVGYPDEIEALVHAAHKTFGKLNILVHCAALGAFKPLHKLRSNQWDLSLNINAKAFLILAQQCLPFMENNGGGNMVALSSLGSRRFISNYGAIGVSKAALETLVKYLAVEFAEKKIRVNCVSGGPVDTDALKSFPQYSAMKEEVVRRTPAGRIGHPDDIASVVAFLVSPAAQWIYGQTIVADGGLSLV